MATVINALSWGYREIFKHADPRTEHFLLMNSPVGVSCLIFFYFFFIFKLGPLIMKGRKPLDITEIVKIYNLTQIIFNFLGFLLGIKLFFSGRKWTCVPIDYSNTFDSHMMLLGHYLYFLMKLLDLLDTLFFILRKKFSQVTFLHCYHHATMVIASWGTFKFIPGGQLLVIGFINVIVHVIMYLYYYISSADPSYKQSVWWKKHITQAQLLQHCIIFVTLVISLLDQNCNYPKIVLIGYLPQVVAMIYLFSEFYYKAYIKPNNKSKTDKSE